MRLAPAACIFVASFAVLGVHAGSHLPFLSDDALITLRYAGRLLEGHGLTWTDGPRVEGYSNLAWLLLCAGAGALGADLIDAARGLGFACAAALLAAVVAAARPRGFDDLLPGATAALAVALSSTVAVWTVGGLEQPLVAALLAWAAVGAYTCVDPGVVPPPPVAVVLRVGVPLAILCWTRPDGALFTAALCAGTVLARRFDRGSLGAAVSIAALPLLAFLAQLAFRVVYYGAWLPNTAHAKLAISPVRLLEGAVYLGSGVAVHLPLFLMAAFAALLCIGDERSTRRLLLLAVPTAAWSAYVVAVGGDTFPAYRHFAPIVALLALMAVEGVRAAAERWPRRVLSGWSAAALVLGGLFLLQETSAETQRARAERWEWDGEVLGRLLAKAFGARQPLLAVDPSGSVPYFSRLPSLDMLGLSDRHIALNPPAEFGRGWLGHELGDGAYVLSQKPDLVLFCSPAGGGQPCFRSGLDLDRMPAFRSGYRLLHLEGDEPYVFRSRIWGRIEGPIGIERGRDRVRIPAHLLTANPASVASWSRLGGLEVRVDGDTPAGYSALELPSGSWEVTVVTAQPAPLVHLSVTPTGSEGWIVASERGSATLSLEGDEPSRIDLRVRVGGARRSFSVREIQLERRPLDW